MFTHTAKHTRTHIANRVDQHGKWCLVRDGDENSDDCLALYMNFQDFAIGKRMEHETTQTLWKPHSTHCQLFEFISEVKK